MWKLIFLRLLKAVPVLFVIATITFFMLRLTPGGPFDREKPIKDPEIKKQLEAHYGLDKSLSSQYFDFLGKLVVGDLGPSFKHSNRQVNEVIIKAFPVSAELGLWSIMVALALGLTAGMMASVKPNSILDYTPMTLAMLGICVPTFVMGPILILIFSLKLEWFNASGWDQWSDRVLPALTLGGVYAAYIARLTRGGMLEVMSQDYIRTARAKGAGELRVLLKHALRGGLMPVVAFLGPAVAGLISGSFVVETIFQIPGLGRHFVEAAFNRDYTMVMGTVLFFAALIILLNLLVDVLQIWLNPRLRNT
ncbi:MAG TPA: ABC transporter [Verrucomicrobiales bacterium]|nr:ABC transporter [Verrucomicrobiales bacterium]HBU59600.1 ABC transporter [Verrucomicrobiales bacterium]|tara:strand:+ start:90 stop:1010 length:921 start_codon:yes stop_codon:yes gene_type:complete